MLGFGGIQSSLSPLRQPSGTQIVAVLRHPPSSTPEAVPRIELFVDGFQGWSVNGLGASLPAQASREYNDMDLSADSIGFRP